MIAVIAIGDQPCLAKWVGRKGMKAVVETYCGQVAEVGQYGVVQLPEQATQVLGMCAACVTALRDPRSWTIPKPEEIAKPVKAKKAKTA